MAEQRFTRLNEIVQTKWIIGCPVEIEKGAILLDTETQKIILQLKLRNVSDQVLIFVSIKIYRYDMADDFIAEKDDPITFAYPDTSIPVALTFGDKVPINLGINSTRKVKIIFDKIVYANDEVWRNPDETEGIEIKQKLISDVLEPNLVEQFNKEFYLIRRLTDITSHIYNPVDYEKYWNCTCGFANQKTNVACGRCRLEKEWLFKVIKDVYLLGKIAQEVIDNKERIYAEALSIKSVANYEKEYKKARSLFLSISGYKDSDKLASESETLAEEAYIQKEKADAENLRIKQEIEQKDKIVKERKKRNIKKIIFVGTPLIIVVIVYLIVLNTVLLPATKYNRALNYLKNKQYLEAVTIFQEIGDYKDSKSILYQINFKNQKISVKGDKISFGVYSQEIDVTSRVQPIVWRVLSIENGKALLISDKNIDSRVYGESEKWENCTLRSWLNNDFFKEAFTDIEKASILETYFKNSKNQKYSTSGGMSTRDHIFLLSIDEATEYFESDADRISKDTEIAKYPFSWDKGWWWLRSPGSNEYGGHCAATVDANGIIDYAGEGILADTGSVRPAMYISIPASYKEIMANLATITTSPATPTFQPTKIPSNTPSPIPQPKATNTPTPQINKKITASMIQGKWECRAVAMAGDEGLLAGIIVFSGNKYSEYGSGSFTISNNIITFNDDVTDTKSRKISNYTVDSFETRAIEDVNGIYVFERYIKIR
jgi:hypothetical protein